MKEGRYNISAGLAAMGIFMAYGFLLIYLRDFHPDKETWIASYGLGKHFEARLAHVHGALFGLLNVLLAFVLLRLKGAAARLREAVALLGLLGLLMPTGILAEVYLGLSPLPVLIGAASMSAAVVLGAWAAWHHWSYEEGRP